mmetsp:Transcript_1329/g.3776  ORF Transcript_1329/g.3776 Transcript_1329/m.3776 type:complete len:88 (-) Transcript_1329:195-458(-)
MCHPLPPTSIAVVIARRWIACTAPWSTSKKVSRRPLHSALVDEDDSSLKLPRGGNHIVQKRRHFACRWTGLGEFREKRSTSDQPTFG